MAVDEKLVELIVRQIVERRQSEAPAGLPPIPVGVSARHIHLTREHMDILFGKGSELHNIKELMGGQFAAQEQVTILGPSLRPIEKVRVLGPLRKQTQIEISRTDTFVLKVRPPVRPSGEIRGSAGLTIVGPCGVVIVEEGCIIANRHIHMSPEDARLYGVRDGDLVECLAEGERRTMLYDVQIRVAPSFTLEMHIDTDDANAIGFTGKPQVTIVKRGG